MFCYLCHYICTAWHITLELHEYYYFDITPTGMKAVCYKEHSVIIKPSKQLHDNPYEDILLEWILKLE